jgi:hypothetical protein
MATRVTVETGVSPALVRIGDITQIQKPQRRQEYLLRDGVAFSVESASK